jgi:protein-S-isoprenylcysteine O-methyltransferase Ste14
MAAILNVLTLAWVVSEIVLALRVRSRRASATRRDRGSLALMWITITLAVAAANLIRSRSVGAIDANRTVILSVAMVLLLAGLILRWAAILTLGRFFTVDVAVQTCHRVVRTGVFRTLRHPSYSGLLLAFLGLGLSYRNWVSLMVMLVPILAAILYRIRVEEDALLQAFGTEYADYGKATKRLIPGIY